MAKHMCVCMCMWERERERERKRERERERKRERARQTDRQRQSEWEWERERERERVCVERERERERERESENLLTQKENYTVLTFYEYSFIEWQAVFSSWSLTIPSYSNKRQADNPIKQWPHSKMNVWRLLSSVMLLLSTLHLTNT